LRAGIDHYVVGKAVPRFFNVDATPTEKALTWFSTDLIGDEELLLDNDGLPYTYSQEEGIDGYDKEELWSKRERPEEERYEEECETSVDAVILEGYESC